MDAEQIVRALAAKDAPIDADYGSCHLCSAYNDVRVEVHRTSGDRSIWVDAVEGHEADCPWRLAREWADQHPAA
jgi:hypothetical protein